MIRLSLSALLLLCCAPLQASVDVCQTEVIKKLRAEALASFKAGDISQAEQILSRYSQPDFSQASSAKEDKTFEPCAIYDLYSMDDKLLNQGLWLLSDLMFYRHKLGDELGCMAIHDQIFMSYLVSDPGRYNQGVAKALEANSNACQQALYREYPLAELCPVEGYGDFYAIPQSWREADPDYYEVSCFRVENTSANLGIQRDGPQYQPEGMNNRLKLELLYTEAVAADGTAKMSLDKLYVADSKGEMVDASWCYNFAPPRVSAKPGAIYLQGDLTPCDGGSGTVLLNMRLQLDYPFAAKEIERTEHSYQ